MKHSILALSTIFLLGACSPTTSEIKPEETKPSESISLVEEKEEVKPAVEYEIPSVGTDVVLQILRDSYREVGIVDYNPNNNTFVMTPNAGPFAVSISEVLETGDTSDWNMMKQTLTELSMQVTKSLNDPYVSLAIANPASTDKLLLVVTDGELIFDGIYEELGLAY